MADRARKPDGRGFTLIELLIVVAIIGIIAAIAIPNLLGAVDRGKQKRTMSDIRSVALAIESYTIDNSHFPTVTDIAGARAVLEPSYVRHLPLRDGWNNDLLAASATAGYTVASQGKDGAGGTSACSTTPTCENFTDSIVFINGQFVQWPEGIQR